MNGQRFPRNLEAGGQVAGRLAKPTQVLQRWMVGRFLLRVGRGLGLLSPVPAKGCGRVPGVIEVGWHAKSVSAFRNYRPPKRGGGAQRFVFDPVQQILIVGEVRRQPVAPGSPHDQLAQVIGAFVIQGDEIHYPHGTGGMLSRTEDGGVVTNEKSRNLGHNWTPDVRQQFRPFVPAVTGLMHHHYPGS